MVQVTAVGGGDGFGLLALPVFQRVHGTCMDSSESILQGRLQDQQEALVTML